jgi:hypothetical protein
MAIGGNEDCRIRGARADSIASGRLRRRNDATRRAVEVAAPRSCRFENRRSRAPRYLGRDRRRVGRRRSATATAINQMTTGACLPPTAGKGRHAVVEGRNRPGSGRRDPGFTPHVRRRLVASRSSIQSPASRTRSTPETQGRVPDRRSAPPGAIPLGKVRKSRSSEARSKHGTGDRALAEMMATIGPRRGTEDKAQAEGEGSAPGSRCHRQARLAPAARRGCAADAGGGSHAPGAQRPGRTRPPESRPAMPARPRCETRRFEHKVISKARQRVRTARKTTTSIMARGQADRHIELPIHHHLERVALAPESARVARDSPGTSDPRAPARVEVYRLRNIVRAEPTVSSFMVPPDFRDSGDPASSAWRSGIRIARPVSTRALAV